MGVDDRAIEIASNALKMGAPDGGHLIVVGRPNQDGGVDFRARLSPIKPDAQIQHLAVAINAVADEVDQDLDTVLTEVERVTREKRESGARMAWRPRDE